MSEIRWIKRIGPAGGVLVWALTKAGLSESESVE